MALLHGLTFVAFLVLALVAVDFRIALVKTAVGPEFALRALRVGAFNIAWLLVVTEAATTTAHVVRAILCLVCPAYVRLAYAGFNLGYFAEFVVSAPLLYAANTLLSGRADVASVVVFAAVFGAVNLGGIAIEWSLYTRRVRGEVVRMAPDVWLPFVVLGAAGLSVVAGSSADFVASVAGSSVPWFVYVFAVVTNINYVAAFAGVFAGQRLLEAKQSPLLSRHPLAFQYAYGMLSLNAKLVPAWLLFVGVLTM